MEVLVGKLPASQNVTIIGLKVFYYGKKNMEYLTNSNIYIRKK